MKDRKIIICHCLIVRKKRLAELKNLNSKPRFGSVLHIVGADFIREVSNASPDVWVVVHLFKNGYMLAPFKLLGLCILFLWFIVYVNWVWNHSRIPDSELLGLCFEELARKYTGTKFVKIIFTECIPNYPDRNVPTVLIYNQTNVKATLVGLHNFGGRRCTPEGI